MPEPAAALLYDCPLPRSPLAGIAMPATLPDATLTERTGLTLLHVDAGRGPMPERIASLALPTVPDTSDMPDCEDGPAALWIGPGRWMLVFPKGVQPIQAPGLTVVDLSHARCVLRLAGPGTWGVLARGCLLDLTRETFDAGRCAQTQMHGIPVLLHAVDFDTVDVHVPRSYALDLWERLAG
ncbi:sarcosine oxidase subunit gamma [Roseospira navarrensis]|nr:hypothetical protein [Roseospira navarrensis]